MSSKKPLTTRIITPIASIAALSFIPWPRNNVVKTSLVRREDYNIYGLLENNTIAVSNLEKSRYRQYRMKAYDQMGVARHASWVGNALSAAVSFRLITADDFKKFMGPIDEWRKIRQQVEEAHQFETLADSLGIKLTKAQAKRLEALERKEPKWEKIRLSSLVG